MDRLLDHGADVCAGDRHFRKPGTALASIGVAGTCRRRWCNDCGLTGRIDVPLVMEWNAADVTIPARFHAVYPDQVRAAGKGGLLTVLAPAGEGHCGFSDAQIGAAFDTLLRRADAARH